MDVVENIARALSPAPFSSRLDWIFSGLRIFLYRDTAPRPEQDFWPVNVDHVRDCPFQRLWLTPHDPDFEVFCDLASLAQPHPLCFYLFTFGLMTEPGVVRGLAFHASVLADPGPSGDLAALRSLLGLLRSFPAGWTQTVDAEIRDGEIRDGEIHHREIIP